MSNCGMCYVPCMIEFLLPYLTPHHAALSRPSCSELIETMKEFLQKQRLHLHFEISSRRLQLMMNLGTIRALEDMGGVEGIAALLLVECDVGLSKEERLDAYIDRIEEYVSSPLRCVPLPLALSHALPLSIFSLPAPALASTTFPTSCRAALPRSFSRTGATRPF